MIMSAVGTTHVFMVRAYGSQDIGVALCRWNKFHLYKMTRAYGSDKYIKTCWSRRPIWRESSLTRETIPEK